MSHVIKIAGLAALYGGMALLSRFSMLQDGTHLIWLPAGLSLAVLLFFGMDLWPGIALGSMITLIAWGTPPWLVLLGTAGEILAPLVAVKLMTLSSHYQPGLKRVSGVLLLAAAGGALAPAIAAAFGWLGLRASATISFQQYFPEWLGIFFNHSLGVLVVAPLALTFFQEEKKPPAWTRGRLFEWLVILSLCVLSVTIANFSVNRDVYRLFSGLVLLWLTWTALRFTMRETTMVLSSWIFFYILTVARYLDILSDNPEFFIFYDLNGVLWAIGLTALLIAATQEENRSHIMALQQNRAELQRLAEAGQIGLWNWEKDTNELVLSIELSQMIGYANQTVSISPEAFIQHHVAPEDYPLMWEKFKELTLGHNLPAFEYRILMPTGEIRHILCEGWAVRDGMGNLLRMAGTGMDITERKRSEMAVMNERLRMSRDLHDSISQSLYSIRLLVQAAEDYAKMGSDSRLQGVLSRLAEVSQQTLKEMRLMIFTLRPPVLETKGLMEALRQRLEIVEARAGVVAEISGGVKEAIPGEIEDCLYRVAQEALNNVSKHAHASRVNVTIAVENGQAELTVTDDGVGFDPLTVRPGLGLPGMREQVERLKGTFEIHSEMKMGTRMRVILRFREG